MHDHVEKFCDEATKEGVDAMIRQRHDGFLQNHIFSRVFPEANKLLMEYHSMTTLKPLGRHQPLSPPFST
jgi:hypothetical protein